MTKARLTITWTDEYEVDPDVYPLICNTLEKCVAHDIIDAEENPFPFMQHGGTFTVHGELIKEEDNGKR